MYLVREVFHTKRDKTKELVNKFMQVVPQFENNAIRDVKYHDGYYFNILDHGNGI